MKIYHVPGTRSVRPIWLAFELGLSVEIETIDFSSSYRNSEEWRRISPAGKIPALTDGDLNVFESGAMIDYILARYGEGRLAPGPVDPKYAAYRQWSWFAEATLIRPLGLYRVLRARSEPVEALIDEAESKFRDSLAAVEAQLLGQDYLLGDEFTAADIMMGYSLALAERLLTDDEPNIRGYLGRLRVRPAYKKIVELRQAVPSSGIFAGTP